MFLKAARKKGKADEIHSNLGEDGAFFQKIRDRNRPSESVVSRLSDRICSSEKSKALESISN